MKNFLKIGLEILVAINLVAWTFPLIDEVKISRLTSVAGVVIDTRLVDELESGLDVSINVKRVRVKFKYEFSQHEYEPELVTTTINGKHKPNNEIRDYYYKGREISVWINPTQPDEARLHRNNPYIALPSVFLFVLLIVLVFYMLARKNNS